MSGYLSVHHTLGYDRFPKFQGHGTVPASEAIQDDLNDILAAKLREFWRARNFSSGWTKEVERLRREVDQTCLLYGYRGLWVDTRDYLVHRVGQSFLFDVPRGKRGNLAEFAGKRIRIVCTHNSTHYRFIRVGVIGEAPERERIEGRKLPVRGSTKPQLPRVLREDELEYTPHVLVRFKGTWNGAGGMAQAFNKSLRRQAAVWYACRTKELTGAWPAGLHQFTIKYGPNEEFEIRTPIGNSHGERETELHFEVHAEGAALTPDCEGAGLNWYAFAIADLETARAGRRF